MHSVPRTIQHQTQTYEQLGISNSRLLIRGLFVRCPACGAGRTHKSWTKMNQRCHRCSLRFERIIGHALGYIGINTSVAFTTTFAVLIAGAVITSPDIPFVPLLAATAVPGVLLPILFLPSSHTLWTAIDLIMRPLLPGEIDPRFIKVDPVAGPWDASAVVASASPGGTESAAEGAAESDDDRATGESQGDAAGGSAQ